MKFYSAKENAFYDSEINVNGMPGDAINISDEEWLSLIEGGQGKILSADKQGKPVRIDRPPLTKQELIEQADSKRTTLMKNTSVAILPLQDAEDLEIASEDESNLLKELKRYRVLLNRVDVSAAPDIEWPVAPQNSVVR